MDLTSKESEVSSSGMEAKTTVEENDNTNEEPTDLSRSSPEASSENVAADSIASSTHNASASSPPQTTESSMTPSSLKLTASPSVAPNITSDNVYESAAKVC